MDAEAGGAGDRGSACKQRGFTPRRPRSAVVGDDRIDLAHGFYDFTRALPATREDPAVTGPQLGDLSRLRSQDPVALDYQGFQIIEKKRKENGLESAALRAKYIQTAAEMGLGTNNPDQMEIKNISLV